MLTQNLLKLVDYPFTYSIVSSFFRNKVEHRRGNGLFNRAFVAHHRSCRNYPRNYRPCWSGRTLEITSLENEAVRIETYHSKPGLTSNDPPVVDPHVIDQVKSLRNKKAELNAKISNAANAHIEFVMKTRWILIEVDKLVALIYFIIVLSSISFALLTPPLSHNFWLAVNQLGEKTQMCIVPCENLHWIMDVIVIVIPLVTAGVVLAFWYELRELVRKTRIVSDYLRLTEAVNESVALEGAG